MIGEVKAVILGLVEGVTEFLPISSTGHLILVNQWIRFDEQFTKLFDVVIQLGAMVAVIIFFRERLRLTRDNIEVWKKAILATLPALVIGALSASLVEKKLFNPAVVASSLIVGGIILIFLELRKKKNVYENFGVLPYTTALLIGVAQCVALIPGTSRSAATIIGALLLGCSRQLATEFSFFVAVPTLGAASLFSLVKNFSVLNGATMPILGIGFITAGIVAWLVIAGLLRFIQHHNFVGFGIYRIIIGIVVILFLLR